MSRISHNQLGLGTVGIVLVVIVLVMIGAGGWLVYKNQNEATSHGKSNPTANTPPKDIVTPTPTTTADSTANWKKVDSIGGAYSIKIPDGWELTNYPDNVLMGDSITLSRGKPAIITTASSAYAGDQKRFSVGFANRTETQDPAPQWQSPSSFGTETKTDFSIGSLKGTRYSIEYTQTVTGVTKGDKIYQYAFTLPGGKGLGAVYMQHAGDADNLKTVEQTIQTIVIN